MNCRRAARSARSGCWAGRRSRPGRPAREGRRRAMRLRAEHRAVHLEALLDRRRRDADMVQSAQLIAFLRHPGLEPGPAYSRGRKKGRQAPDQVRGDGSCSTVTSVVTRIGDEQASWARWWRSAMALRRADCRPGHARMERDAGHRDLVVGALLEHAFASSTYASNTNPARRVKSTKNSMWHDDSEAINASSGSTTAGSDRAPERHAARAAGTTRRRRTPNRARGRPAPWRSRPRPCGASGRWRCRCSHARPYFLERRPEQITHCRDEDDDSRAPLASLHNQTDLIFRLQPGNSLANPLIGSSAQRQPTRALLRAMRSQTDGGREVPFLASSLINTRSRATKQSRKDDHTKGAGRKEKQETSLNSSAPYLLDRGLRLKTEPGLRRFLRNDGNTCARLYWPLVKSALGPVRLQRIVAV